MTLPPTKDAVPRQLRVGTVLVAAQGLALFVIAALLVVKTIIDHPDSVSRALLGAAMALLGAAALLACARGLLALRPAARTPVVVLELLALPVSYSLGFEAGRLAYGAPIMLSALAVLYLLFTPASRAVLDRELDRDRGEGAAN
jgi:hypothetical protein